MAQWGVQLVIGKLVTDEAFRQRFEARARESLAGLSEQGIDLSEREVDAFLEIDPNVWAAVARQMYPLVRQAPASRALSNSTAQKARGSLTAREKHVLWGICEGLTNKQIALEIGVSESAIKATLQHVFRKTHVRTRAQLVRVVIEGSLGAAPGGR
jgi:DNA-binding NarL/FixJ family response regulator